MARTINLETNRVLHHARFARGAFDSAFFSLVLHLRKPFTRPNSRSNLNFDHSLLSCPLAPRTESYDTRIVETRACPHPIRAVFRLPAIAVASVQVEQFLRLHGKLSNTVSTVGHRSIFLREHCCNHREHLFAQSFAQSHPNKPKHPKEGQLGHS